MKYQCKYLVARSSGSCPYSYNVGIPDHPDLYSEFQANKDYKVISCLIKWRQIKNNNTPPTKSKLN